MSPEGGVPRESNEVFSIEPACQEFSEAVRVCLCWFQPDATVVFWGERVRMDTSVYRPGEPTREKLKATASHLLLTP